MLNHKNVKMTLVAALASVGGAGMLVSGCNKSEGVTDFPNAGSQFKVSVAALSLQGVTDADYRLEVQNASGDLVFERDGLTSQQFGDGAGALSYVGACDASTDEQPNTVTLTLNGLMGPGGAAIAESEWRNPTPVTLSRNCVENADVPIDFNLVIARDADQGFFDVAVNFADIFCSAKLDCQDADGDLTLLHNPATGERDTTVVMAFACTAGQGDVTYLHMNEVLVECDDGLGGRAQHWINPAEGPGNAGGSDPALFQTGIYRGKEDLPGIDKCYWNLALGVDEGEGAQNCVVVGSGTASPGEWPDGNSPDNTVWPVVGWNVPITDAAGEVMCGSHPLNGEGSLVQTSYTSLEGENFAYAMTCQSAEVTKNNKILCDGFTVGEDSVVAFTVESDSVVMTMAGAVTQGYKLPAGYGIEGCCANPCCGQ